MALPRPNLLKLALPALVFALALGLLAILNSGDGPEQDAPAGDTLQIGASTEQRIRGLEEAVRARPADPRGQSLLGEAYLQRVRESGDTALYARAEAAFEAALRRSPGNVDATIGMGTLALARHDFAGGLREGLRARRLAPSVVRPYALLVDAQIELGRYGDAARSLQRMVDLKPTLASYARVSYLRELRGDLTGAAEAMRLAVSAGGGAAENVAYVQSLAGNLDLARGRIPAAGEAYRLAQARVPGYVPATLGLARVAAAQGDLDVALARMTDAAERRPGADTLYELGELELAAGRGAAGRRHVAEALKLEREAARVPGVNRDAHSILYEAGHGSRNQAVAIGRAVYRRAPSVSSADALGWALTRAGRPREGLEMARRALRLGSRDAQFLYHAGVAAAGAGLSTGAREYLRRALATGLRTTPLAAAHARRTLART